MTNMEFTWEGWGGEGSAMRDEPIRPLRRRPIAWMGELKKTSLSYALNNLIWETQRKISSSKNLEQTTGSVNAFNALKRQED